MQASTFVSLLPDGLSVLNFLSREQYYNVSSLIIYFIPLYLYILFIYFQSTCTLLYYMYFKIFLYLFISLTLFFGQVMFKSNKGHTIPDTGGVRPDCVIGSLGWLWCVHPSIARYIFQIDDVTCLHENWEELIINIWLWQLKLKYA